MVDLSKANWRKASRSDNGGGGNCVMLADNLPGVVAVHDSKVGPQAGTHVFDRGAFASFLADVKAGQYDR